MSSEESGYFLVADELAAIGLGKTLLDISLLLGGEAIPANVSRRD